MPTTRVLLVRHGATDWNLSKRAQGQADIDLNATGRRQTRELARRLAETEIHGVYSSDMKRALDTAQVIADPRGLEVHAEAGFREIDQGEWEGLTTEEIRKRWPELWGDARHYTERPGGESPAQVRARALAALTDVVRSHPDETVVIVSHGGTIRWLSAEVLGYDDLQSARIRGLGNGGVVCFDASLDGGDLTLSNLTRLDRKTTDLDDPND